MKTTVTLMFAILIIMLSAAAFRTEYAIELVNEVKNEQTVIITNNGEEGDVINILIFPGKEGVSNKVLVKNGDGQVVNTIYLNEEGRFYKNKKHKYYPKTKGNYNFEVHDYWTNKKVSADANIT